MDYSTFNLFKELQTDEDLETTGTWVWPYGPEVMDGKKTTNPGFKLARMGGANTKYDKANTAYLRPYQRLIQARARDMDEHVMKLIKDAAKSAFIDTALLDWKNVFNKAGEPIPFSKEGAKELLIQIPQLYNDLADRAMDLKTFQQESSEVDAGN